MKRLASAVFLLVCAAAAPAQMQAPTGEAERTAMARLAYMAGRWTGEGWMDMGGGRHAFRGGEVVQSKLRGAVLLVEGDFTGKVGEGGREGPVHTTLGVIFYDARAGKYRFHTWLATGQAGQYELVPKPDGWQWELELPQMRIRYTSKFTAGEWFEIGERSTDGTNWQKFFEMTLRKAP